MPHPSSIRHLAAASHEKAIEVDGQSNKDPRIIRRNMKPAILVRMLMMEVYAVRTPILSVEYM